MKKFLKCFLILFIPILLTGCDNDDESLNNGGNESEPEVELKLSIDDKNPHWVEDTDVEFDILSGNGGYEVTVENEDIAKASVKETKVSVNFICNGYTKLTVTDTTKRSVQLSFSVYNPTLIPNNYTVFSEKGTTTTIEDLSFFGSGSGYRVESVKGTSARLKIEGKMLTIEALDHGNTYCDVIDGRGTKMPFTAIVVAVYELASENLNVIMKKDQRASISCVWGEGWQIILSHELCKASIIPASKPDGHDTLQIDSYPDKSGNCTITLKNKEGKTAQVYVSVER